MVYVLLETSAIAIRYTLNYNVFYALSLALIFIKKFLTTSYANKSLKAYLLQFFNEK